MTTERFPAPPLEDLPVRTLGELVLDSAARQASWSITAHHEFLETVSGEIGNATGTPLLLTLSPEAPQDPVLLPPPKIALPCASEAGPFDHAFDLDDETISIEPDPILLARGKQLCSQCPIKVDCLNYGVTSLELQDGLFGGQPKEERQAAWRHNNSQRIGQLRHAYGLARSALLACIKESDENDRDAIREALVALGKQFVVPRITKREDLAAAQRLEPDIRELLADTALIEWAEHLMYPASAARILRHWATACRQATDPFKYDFGASKAPSTASLQRTEESIKHTLRELASGEFNYRWWYNQVGSSAHNALSFLIVLGEPIPDGDYEAAKRIGRQKINVLGPTLRPSRSLQGAEALLIAYFGLGEDEPISIKELAAQYDLQPSTITNTINNNVRKLRALCGNMEENEEEDEGEA